VGAPAKCEAVTAKSKLDMRFLVLTARRKMRKL
jgi:hypothetical protein